MSNIKTRLLAAFVLPVLMGALLVPSVVLAQESTEKPGKVIPGTSTEKPAKNLPPRAPRVNNTRVQANLVVPNRYVFVALAYVNEPYFIYRPVRNPQTGQVVVVPVVYYQRRLVQVYLDQLTNTYFYFDSFGNPTPYVRYGW